MSDLEALFGGMALAESSGQQADFFKGGVYSVTTKSFEFRDGYKGKSFIAKFVIDASNNPEVAVGSTRSWIVKLDGTKEQKTRAMGDIKNLFFALQGLNPDKVKKPEIDPTTHKEASHAFFCSVDAEYAKTKGEGIEHLDFIGLPVKLEATEVDTKPKVVGGAPGKFTRHAWMPSEETTAS
jgi:hypothetical protein